MSLLLHNNDYQAIHDYLAAYNLILKPEWFTSRTNIKPHQALWVMYSSFGKKKMMPAEWAMNPNWAKKGQIPRALTVARAESVFDRVSYKALIKRYRALIPVNGFVARSLSRNRDGHYEMYEFSDSQQEAFSLAALYQFNVDGNMQVVLLTKAVKVPVLKKTMRMPLIIEHKQVDEWLESEKAVKIKNSIKTYQLPVTTSVKSLE